MNKYSFELNGETIEYTIKDYVTYEDFVAAYGKIVSSTLPPVVDEDLGEPVYSPILGWLAEGYGVISMFTDIDIDGKDNEYVWSLCAGTDVIDKIIESPSRRKIAGLVGSLARSYVDDYKSRILSNTKRNLLYDALIDVISPTEEDMDIKGVGEILNKISGMSESDMLKALVSATKENK